MTQTDPEAPRPIPEEPRRPRRLVPWILVGLLAAGGLAAGLRGGGEGKPSSPDARPPVPVKTAVAQRKAVPLQLRAVGTVEADAEVLVKSRVDGQLERIHFREGDAVSRGMLLFTIDPRPYEAAVQEARARLLRDEALAEKAEVDARRYAGLASRDFVSADRFEQMQVNAKALRATVEADRAALERAVLQLDWCFIRSPIDGVAGRRLVDEGAQVKANDDKGGLVELYRIQPVFVRFAVPQRHLPEIMARRAAGENPTVEAFLPGPVPLPETGRLAFLDPRVDPQTGTVLLKARFENRERLLWPGQFVSAVLTLAIRPDTLVIPAVALQSGQQGSFVWVVTEGRTVEPRPVTPGRTTGEEIVIDSGLNGGETVVVEGQLRLTAGARVQVVSP
ncbi:MAG: efflux RND transporter periplasmic adaptor subunit [Desulfobacterales bacterium]